MTGLDLTLLGPPRVVVDGSPLTVDTRKAVALLAKLAVSGPQRREALAALLWSESDDAHARGSLRRTLSVLNRALDGRWIQISRSEVALDVADADCDVHRFEAMVARAAEHEHPGGATCPECLERLSTAAGLYRGDFLEGFELRDSPDFDDWRYAEAERLRRTLTDLLDRLVNELARTGAYDEALRHAHRRLRIDPLHEPTHRRAMLLHAWQGRRGEAVQQYRECVVVLRRELGVAPLEQTTQLYEAIVAGRHAQPPEPARPTTEPVASTTAAAGGRRTVRDDPLPLVGREAEQSLLRTAHEGASGSGRIVAIQGEAGVGKSRLARWLVEDAERRGATAITVRCHEGESSVAYGAVAEALRAALERPRQLGTVSDAWLREAARLVPELEEAVPAVTAEGGAIDTPEARRRFLEGLRRTLLAALSGPVGGVLVIDDLHWIDGSSLDVLVYLANRLQDTPLCLVLAWRDDALRDGRHIRRLLADRAAATRIELHRLPYEAVAELVGEVDLGDGEDEVTRRLYRETEGLPLFVIEYLRALRDGDSNGDWSVPAGVRELLAERLADLSETARQVITAAAVIGRSFDLETLLHASGRSEEELVDALDELVSGGYVTEVGSGPSPTYDFRHEKLREIVNEESTLARRRLLHGRIAEDLTRRHRHGDAAASAALAAYHLHHAGREAEAAEQYRVAGDRARALSAHAEAVEHYRSALALDHPDPTSLNVAIGEVLTLRGDYSGALTAYETAAAVASDPAELARVELAIALVHERRGDWAAADAHITAGLAALPAGERGVHSALLVERALTSLRRGDLEEARDGAAEALALAEAADVPGTFAQAHNVLGMVARASGQREAATAAFERSLEVAGSLTDPSARIAALNNLALASADTGDHARGLELAKTALALCRRQGDRHREAALLNNLADLLRAAGQTEEAERHVRDAVALFADVGEPERLEPEIWKLTAW